MRRFSYGFFIAILLALAGCQPGGFFGPAGLTATPPGELVRRAVPLTFVQLNADPVAYQDQYIQIQGAYLELPVPDCNPYRGPAFVWSLADLATDVTQRLRVDVQGFEDVIHLVPEGTPITVEGYWRLYQGPLGCGKNAPRQAVWYLEVLRIMAPNPFPGVVESPRVTPAEEPQIEITPLATLTPTPATSATPDLLLTPSTTPSATMTLSVTASPDPLLTPSGTPTLALTPGTTLTVTITPTPPGEGTPEPTPTLEGGYPPPGVPPTSTLPPGYP
jgi:hypothetical protein